jgi:hypothetical protein
MTDIVKVMAGLFLMTMLTMGFKTFPAVIAQLDAPLEDVESSDNNQTGTAIQNSSSPADEVMVLKAQMKPDSNPFLAKDGWYQVKKFGFVASNGSQICPLNNCKYGVENSQFTPNSISGGYVFEGRLKVTISEDNTKKSKFYDFRVDLNKASEEERNGKKVQFLEGTFGFGKDKFSPDFDYDITNATYSVDKKSPLLTIHAERSPL